MCIVAYLQNDEALKLMYGLERQAKIYGDRLRRQMLVENDAKTDEM